MRLEEPCEPVEKRIGRLARVSTGAGGVHRVFVELASTTSTVWQRNEHGATSTNNW